MNINEKIKELIDDGNITIEELALRIGVTRQQIGRWKRGTSEPVASNLMKLCKIYNVSADYILGLPKGLNWPREPRTKGNYHISSDDPSNFNKSI